MKNFFVVGGSSGIGRQLALDLAVDHRVFATWKTNHQQGTDHLSYHQLDATQESFSLDFLPEELHGFVYCPGAINLKPFARLKPADFIDDYCLQFLGAVRLLQEVLPRLKKAESSSVVFFSSVAVDSGFGFHSLVASSKGALQGIARSLAAELAPGIRVNCIAPSMTDTKLAGSLLSTPEKRLAGDQRHPLKRIGSAADIAKAAGFLLTAADWITGQVLHVDGGLSTLKPLT